MAETGAEEVPRGSGFQFAERQMLRHGWEHGKGLGRDENGIQSAIKVKVKCDKGGIGHKEGDQFKFHWWDHVFNQTSASLQVESDHTGPKLHKNSSENDGAISNKRPLKYSRAKDKLYGAFVKSATLVSGLERAVENASSDSSSSSDEDELKLDLSSTTKLSDAELVKACGGRTAHKGARHGLKMSAKLARLEQQEAEFMAKYGKKTTQPEKENNVIGASEGNDVKIKKKSKDCEAAESATCLDAGESGQAEEVKSKKKKKKKRDCVEEIQIQQNDDAQESPPPPKKKKKKDSME
ncbi:G patch domain-containing protein 4 [Eucyclogobius newberryi]|uniref:G patch domain-containing protein 4 n=1 Tax=Eucyclogobius newberryi TaxID=166745 RepID=UPI003B5BD351